MFSTPTEAIFDAHRRVFRTALVGVGSSDEEEPHLFVEPLPGEFPRTSADRDAFVAELLALAAQHTTTREIQNPWQILFERALPVDVRHNAKIRREELAARFKLTELPENPENQAF